MKEGKMEITLNTIVSNGLIANEGVLTQNDIKSFWEYVNDNFLDLVYKSNNDSLSTIMVYKKNNNYYIEKNRESDFVSIVFKNNYYNSDIQLIFLRIKKRNENYNKYLKKLKK